MLPFAATAPLTPRSPFTETLWVVSQDSATFWLPLVVPSTPPEKPNRTGPSTMELPNGLVVPP
jgi:hypothetical protein